MTNKPKKSNKETLEIRGLAIKNYKKTDRVQTDRVQTAGILGKSIGILRNPWKSIRFGRNLVEMNPSTFPDLSKQPRALENDQKTKKNDKENSRKHAKPS